MIVYYNMLSKRFKYVSLYKELHRIIFNSCNVNKATKVNFDTWWHQRNMKRNETLCRTAGEHVSDTCPLLPRYDCSHRLHLEDWREQHLPVSPCRLPAADLTSSSSSSNSTGTSARRATSSSANDRYCPMSQSVLLIKGHDAVLKRPVTVTWCIDAETPVSFPSLMSSAKPV